MNRRRFIPWSVALAAGRTTGVSLALRSLAGLAAALAWGPRALAQGFNANERPPSPQEQQIEFDRDLRRRVGARPVSQGRVTRQCPFACRQRPLRWPVRSRSTAR
jgi:hypothetical protein